MAVGLAAKLRKAEFSEEVIAEFVAESDSRPCACFQAKRDGQMLTNAVLSQPGSAHGTCLEVATVAREDRDRFQIEFAASGPSRRQRRSLCRRVVSRVFCNLS